jgi:hypothetical protein
VIDVPTRLESLLALEFRQRGDRARAELPVHRADVEALRAQSHLHLTDLLNAQAERACRWRPAHLSAGRCASGADLVAGGHDGNDLVTAVDDHDVITHHEELMVAPFRMNPDQHVRDRSESHACRYYGADADREVDAVHPRQVGAREHLLANLGALLRVQLHGTAGLSRLALLCLALLWLTRLRLTLCWWLATRSSSRWIRLAGSRSATRGARAALTGGLARLARLCRLALRAVLRIGRLSGGPALLGLAGLCLRRLLPARCLAGGLASALARLTLRALLGLTATATFAATGTW